MIAVTSHHASLTTKETVGVVALFFVVVEAACGVVLLVWREALGTTGSVAANILLAAVNVAAAFYFAANAGIGTAGAIAFPYGIVCSVLAIFFARQRWDALPVAIGLVAFSFVIAITLGGIDFYNLSHCLNNGQLC